MLVLVTEWDFHGDSKKAELQNPYFTPIFPTKAKVVEHKR